MITSIARKITSYFVINEIISNKEKEIYEFCLEILLSTIINFAFVVVVSFICNKVFETLFYLVGFIPLRRYAGGYHAKNHFCCFCTLVVSYSLFLILLFFIVSRINCSLIIIIQLSSLVFTFIFAPIENKNNPVTTQRKDSFRWKSRVVVLIDCFVCLCMLPLSLTYSLCIAIGTFTLSLSLIAAKLKEKAENVN